ncbi:hypothetical protein ACJMK2_021955 [Sinanodonta woodiana]|uniref:Uncharacterized protein n=1 Tax=Sinanodonta woodiana TaxID=1069815 RepID=A0ABD3TIU7_SINWO
MSDNLSDDDLHLYTSQSFQSDVEFGCKRPETATPRATSYSRTRLFSTDFSESDIDLDETNSSHNDQSLKLRTPLAAQRISACSSASTPVHAIAKDKSEKGLLKMILQNQKEILRAIKKNEKEIRSLKTKLEERDAAANFKGPIKVPLQIRNAVHEAYASGLDRGLAWQFDKKSYIQGIYPTVDCLVLKAAMTRYYITQKETDTRKTRNKLDEHKVRQVRYERKKEKSKRRLTALDKKETWNLGKKAKVRKVLDKVYMSSDEEGADSGLVSQPPSWESDTFQKVKEIVDSKYLDICSTRSKRLLLKRTRGVKKNKDTPDVPEDSKWIIQA